MATFLYILLSYTLVVLILAYWELMSRRKKDFIRPPTIRKSRKHYCMVSGHGAVLSAPTISRLRKQGLEVIIVERRL